MSLMGVSMGSAAAQNRIQVFGSDRLASAQNWSESDASFTPSSPGHDATVSFPAGKWSALIGTLPLNKLDGSFSTHIRCRWTGDLTGDKGASATVQFVDADSHDMPGASHTPIPVSGEWQDVTVSAKVPKGAVTLRYDIDCGAGGTLEIEDYALSLESVDLTDAAINGVVMPWLTVPGGSVARRAGTAESAGAQFTATAPYSFDAPLWTRLQQYPIPTTADNKTPQGDVSASFQMAWTPESLFVRYHAHDPILNFKARSRYERDCFEFFLLPTGHTRRNGTPGAKEQYTVTRTADGRTDTNGDAITRLVPGGWEAIIKIPLQTEARRVYPFNGLEMTFNAVYQDADTLPQEHWLSFSRRDQENNSWQDTSLYVPLLFETDSRMAYRPLYLGASTDAYNVEPKFPGRINLVHASASLANIDLWDKMPEAHLSAYAEDGHNIFRIRYPAQPRQRRVVFDLSPFNVLAGEKLDITMDGRADAGPDTPAPGIAFLSESSWNVTGAGLARYAVIGPQWGRLSYTMTMPDTARGSLRNGRILVTVGTFPGRTIELRDIRVTRRLPTDFDALISVPSHYSHFWRGEPNTLNFQFVSGAATQAKITARVQDYFTGKILMSRVWTKAMPVGQARSSWDVSALPNGFFDVLLNVRDAKGRFLADRELYVSKSVRNTRPSPFSGIFVANNYDVAAPASIPDTVAMLKGIGEGRAQWADFYLFDSEGNDLPGDPLALLRAFHRAGLETGYTVPQGGTHDIGRPWQPDELLPFYDRFVTRTKGLFSHLSFSNEPNLYGGWFPEPDAREWAIYNRGWYNMVRRDAPATRPILGSFNDIPVDYMRAAATENGNSFADGVIGMHLYGLEPNGGGFKNVLESRRALDKIHPGWAAWDTESGVVFYTFEGALDLQSKKMPILLNAGYTSSIYLDGYGYTFPCGDSTPLIPMEAFKNKFYLDSAPVGRMTTADGKVDAYLFRRLNGQGVAAFWNTSNGAAAIDLPIRGRATLFDLFGNSMGTLTAGKRRVALNDRFVRYIQGIDLAPLMKNPTFIAAFKSTRAKPATDMDGATRVYMSLPSTTKAFDRQITIGLPSAITLSLHNDGTAPRKIILGSHAPDGLRVKFPNTQDVVLKPRQTQIITAQIEASKSLVTQSLVLTGTSDDGLKLLPLVFSITTTPPIDVSGYTRAVEITNHSTGPADVSVVATKPEFVFQPGVVKETLASATSLTAPLWILPNDSYHGNFNTLNVSVYYVMSVTSPQGTYTKDGRCTLFSPGPNVGGPADFTTLPYTAVPEHPGSEPFQADYNLIWTSGGLRVIARVHDTSPVQTGENGYLRAGGDCMILAFDPASVPASAGFGANYFECGFAYSHRSPTSYTWNGHFGLESATPFPAAVNKIDRDVNYIYYDVTIPETRIYQQEEGRSVGMSIAFLNRGSDKTLQIIELGQGIFPQRSPDKMGLLLGRK